jgi:hypothetical protein
MGLAGDSSEPPTMECIIKFRAGVPVAQSGGAVAASVREENAR